MSVSYKYIHTIRIRRAWLCLHTQGLYINDMIHHISDCNQIFKLVFSSVYFHSIKVNRNRSCTLLVSDVTCITEEKKIIRHEDDVNNDIIFYLEWRIGCSSNVGRQMVIFSHLWCVEVRGVNSNHSCYSGIIFLISVQSNTCH